MKQHSRYQTVRRLLIFWTLFVAIGAVGGALGMLLDPSGKRMGMDTMLPYFQVLPFHVPQPFHQTQMFQKTFLFEDGDALRPYECLILIKAE